MPATPKAQEEEHEHEPQPSSTKPRAPGTFLELQRKEQVARRENKEQQELGKRGGNELQEETTAETELEARKEKEAVEKKDASSDTTEAEEDARILSLLEPAYPRRQGDGRGRKPKPKKFQDNFVSESEGDEDDPPHSPVAVKKKTPVKARKKRDLFDEVTMSESEEVDDPKALGYLGTGSLETSPPQLMWGEVMVLVEEEEN